METRQFIPYATNVAIRPASQPKQPCMNCNIPRLPETPGDLCDVCWGMLEAVSNPYWLAIQRKYWADEREQVNLKARLMNPNYGDDCDPSAEEA